MQGNRIREFLVVEGVGWCFHGFKRDGVPPVAGERIAGEDMHVPTLLPYRQARTIVPVFEPRLVKPVFGCDQIGEADIEYMAGQRRIEKAGVVPFDYPALWVAKGDQVLVCFNRRSRGQREKKVVDRRCAGQAEIGMPAGGEAGAGRRD